MRHRGDYIKDIEQLSLGLPTANIVLFSYIKLKGQKSTNWGFVNILLQGLVALIIGSYYSDFLQKKKLDKSQWLEW